jgi:hypothetical protein
VSLEEEPQLGAVREEIARRHDDDARMALLNRLCARGYGGTDPKRILKEELAMPRGVRATPCPGCGSKATNHKDCDGKMTLAKRANGVAAAPAAEPEPVRAADTGPERIDEDLAALTVEQLVSLRRQVDAELVTRGDRLRAELRAIEAACGAAVDGERATS